MAYQAIYRKWRPLIFEDIVGQTHVTGTLKKQIQSGKVAHAYLFCGTRGTGKTTAAKVFSKAVNCLHPADGSPCNECEICKGIADGSILDVSEIDAASNNGVDSIREIREDVNYVASRTKYRVYIIDEVHMLSTGAFNALLKTLEEPPEHVIFILATTEAHKVPETILSRCQRFDFKRIRPADIVVRMKEIAAGDGLKITEEAYNMLARLADGSMRDGLSIMERCLAECTDTLTVDDINSVLGITSSHAVAEAAEAVIDNDTGKILQTINELSADGKDLNVFAEELMKYFRDLLVCKTLSEPSGILDNDPEDLVLMKAMSKKVSFETLSAYVSILSRTRAEARKIKNPRITYEIALIKMTQPELEKSYDMLLARVEKLEEQIKEGITVKEVSQKAEKKETAEKKPKKEVSARLYVPLDKASLSQNSPIVVAARKWDKTAQAIAKKLPFVAGAVTNRKITIDGEGIILLFARQEVMLKKIATAYINSIRQEFEKNVGGDFAFKTAFEDELEGNIIDYWKIGGNAQSEKSQTATTVSKEDPLDALAKSFPEIIEMTDESDFKNYTPEHFEQTEIEENETEEFLDDEDFENE